MFCLSTVVVMGLPRLINAATCLEKVCLLTAGSCWLQGSLQTPLCFCPFPARGQNRGKCPHCAITLCPCGLIGMFEGQLTVS